MNIDFENVIIQKKVIDNATHQKSKKLNIAYGVDRNFLFGSGISMTSVLVNNPDIDIHFYVVTDYVDDEPGKRGTTHANVWNNGNGSGFR
nr:glycosyltransferase [Citrobacter koseri]